MVPHCIRIVGKLRAVCYFSLGSAFMYTWLDGTRPNVYQLSCSYVAGKEDELWIPSRCTLLTPDLLQQAQLLMLSSI